MSEAVTADLKGAVLAYLDECGVEEVPPGPYDAPTFRSVHDPAGGYRVEHMSGRPAVTAVALELLDPAAGYLPLEGVGWDGSCLTMPGDLRYRPVGLTPDGRTVVCRRVGP
jgi:hypothetical protein